MLKKDFIAIILIITSVFLFLALTGTLTSGYHFVDDHEIVRIKKDFESMNTFEVTKKWLKYDMIMRFRPLYYFHRIVETKLFGSNFFLWSLYTGVLACITLISFYLAMRNFKFNVWESLLFLIISFIGQQMTIWWRLGPNETIGIVFLSLSFLFMSRNLINKSYLNNILFSVFLIFSSLSKESFVIIIPGIIIFKILYEKEVHAITIKKALLSNLILIVPIITMIIEIYIIVFYVGTNMIGYAGLDSSILNTLYGAFNIIKGFLPHRILLVLALAVVFIRFLIYKRLFKLKLLILPFILFLFIVIPNLIIYAKSGMWERYLLPSIVGVAFLVISTIRALDDKLSWLKLIIVFAIFIYYIPSMKSSVNDATTFAKEGENIKSLVHGIIENNSDSQLLMAVDPVVFYEQSYSFKTFLEYEYNINLFGYALNNSTYEEFAERQTSDWYIYFKGRTMDDLDSIPGIIILLDKSLVSDFFEITDYRHSDYKNILDENSLFALLIKRTQ
ncbi:MAG: hypothetical protein KAQ75_04865 [Bacteroidales bacterium]|nr:hypothetical protein [Bacteroidales bacterium]